ncbi:MAG: hypothetical protein RBU26_10610 [Sphaerochaeta sp.]|jgi:hypothetical protein|uniref:hypothetical protein n=1 Tax=Sphaerochaeta sp. TaxID=1972642 RepID=UPI002A3717E9|nr:hypothetical protein [Sphaerochaeta sp.]MDX9825377.1 hypothetical protein [Sphaerochaeta sp.]
MRSPTARVECFNEYAMSETLDAIAGFEEDRLFTKVMEQLRHRVDIDTAHLQTDTTNFTVAGEYDDGGVEMLILSSLPPEESKVLHHLGSPYEKAFEGSV